LKVLTTDKNDPKFWGIGIESAEERIEWKRNSSPWQWSGVELIFDSPFVRKFKRAIETVERIIQKDGVLPRNQAILDILMAGEPIRRAFYFTNYSNLLALSLKHFETFEGLLSGVEQAMEKPIQRARTRKGDIRQAQLSVRETREELRRLYDTLSPIHLTLDAHFGAQVLSMPRKETHESTVAAHFYEPLYTFRDQFFQTGDVASLRQYLSSHEVIVKERYYREELLETSDPEEFGKVQALVDSLSDDLYIYVLMEEAK
jgi:hypothetical protein